MADVCLQVNIRHKEFPSSPPVLGKIKFNVKRREFVSILAPSGAGKTTLLRLIAGLDTNYVGEIYASGKRVIGPGLDRGIIFQESRLLPWLTAEANIAFALPESASRAERTRRTKHILEVVSLSNSRHLLPYQLSGGMERRVALARALVNLPEILLLDEPLSALDLSIRYALQNEIAALHSREELTTILVTHDVDEAIFLSDRIIVLGGNPTSIIGELCVTFPRLRERSDSAYISERKKLMEAVLRGHM
jgi:sulfonate transport system ATP-binding protein